MIQLTSSYLRLIRSFLFIGLTPLTHAQKKDEDALPGTIIVDFDDEFMEDWYRNNGSR